MPPAGLDGNPEPIVTVARTEVLDAVATRIEALPAGRRLVAIDGIDGAGKSTFADELATLLAERNRRPVLRSTVDSFHRARAERHRRGRDSPEGFYFDSHDVDTLLAVLLEPFGAGAEVRLAAFDEPTDQPVDAPLETVAADSLLVFDGIFLQRPELVSHWDLVIYLDGRGRVARRRKERVARDRPLDPRLGLLHDLHWWSLLRRYVDGQRLYHEVCDPIGQADLVVDNDDLAHPRLVARSDT